MQQELQVVRIDIVEIVRELLLKHVLDSFLESHWLLILATHLSSASSPNTSAVCALVARTFVATWHPRPGKVSTLIRPVKPQLSTPLSSWKKNKIITPPSATGASTILPHRMVRLFATRQLLLGFEKPTTNHTCQQKCTSSLRPITLVQQNAK